ncbi:MAG: hypothetical protein AAGJ35_10060, partial [Myxococcota bacterium]
CNQAPPAPPTQHCDDLHRAYKRYSTTLLIAIRQKNQSQIEMFQKLCSKTHEKMKAKCSSKRPERPERPDGKCSERPDGKCSERTERPERPDWRGKCSERSNGKCSERRELWGKCSERPEHSCLKDILDLPMGANPSKLNELFEQCLKLTRKSQGSCRGSGSTSPRAPGPPKTSTPCRSALEAHRKALEELRRSIRDRSRAGLW